MRRTPIKKTAAASGGVRAKTRAQSAAAVDPVEPFHGWETQPPRSEQSRADRPASPASDFDLDPETDPFGSRKGARTELSWDRTQDVGVGPFFEQDTPGSGAGGESGLPASPREPVDGVQQLTSEGTSDFGRRNKRPPEKVISGGGGEQAAATLPLSASVSAVVTSSAAVHTSDNRRQPVASTASTPVIRLTDAAVDNYAAATSANLNTTTVADLSMNPWRDTHAATINYGAVGRTSTTSSNSRTGSRMSQLMPNSSGTATAAAAPPSRSTTPTPDVSIAKGRYLMRMYQTEYENLDIDMYSDSMLEELCSEANGYKRAMARVEERLLGIPGVEVESEQFSSCRLKFVAFIRSAQHKIKSRVEARSTATVARARIPSAATAQPPPTQDPSVTQVAQSFSSLSMELKADRVNAREQSLINEMEGLAEEAKALLAQHPDSDTSIRVYAERSKGVKERAAEVAKEAKTLYQDAVDAGLSTPARAIYDCMQLMVTSAREAAGRLYEFKATSRVGLGGGGARESDFPAPHFGGGSDEDLYRFLDLFTEYVDARGLSEAESLRAMKSVSLKGQLANTCQHFDSLHQIKPYLTEVYGQPRLLLDGKIREFLRNGKCPIYPAQKRRDWLIKVQNSLDYLLKLCAKFHLTDELMFSDVMAQVHANLPPKVHQEYLRKVAELPLEQRTRRRLFHDTKAIIDREVVQATADVNTAYTLGLKESEKTAEKAVAKRSINVVTLDSDDSDEEELAAAAPPVATVPSPSLASNRKKRSTQRKTANQTALQVAGAAAFSPPADTACVVCKKSHTHMFYCQGYQEAGMDDRIQMAKAQGACRRCLRMDSGLDLTNRSAWFTRHDPNCQTDWSCSYEWTCGKASKSGQIHMTLCKRHVKSNKDKEQAFISSLDKNKLSPNTKFFYASFKAEVLDTPADYAPAVYESDVVRAGREHAIYMLHTVYNEQGKDLLLFYDSGCSVAAISQEAAETVGTRNVVPGPTYLNTAGGQTFRNEGGIDEFVVDLADPGMKLEMRGLVMKDVTNPIALYHLQEAYDELAAAHAVAGGGKDLPAVPPTVGGRRVDFMVGIKYLRFFPVLNFSLPSGLSIYTAQIRTLCGNQGVIGGPHSSWNHAAAQMEYMSPFSFLSAELRAYRAHANALEPGAMSLEHVEEEEAEPWDVSEAENASPAAEDHTCSCTCHNLEGDGLWSDSVADFHSLTGFDAADHIGADLPYRCMRCRNCSDCKRGELIEETSLAEEAEQALIESVVWLLPEKKRLECNLPFIKDPKLLTDNKEQAEKIFNSQLRSFAKNPAMKEAVLQAHQKLLDKGHVMDMDELTPDERKEFDKLEGKYVVPWSCVAKPDSISTPFRVVFNASFRTKSGESLNSVLAKGINNLPRILHLLIRFSARKFAMSADVSMAYNAIKLTPAYFRYQQYLWKEDLDETKPTKIMLIKTVIYGVRPSGNLTGVGFVKTAEFAEQHYPELSEGAQVIKQDTYVDDSVTSRDTLEACILTAEAMEKVLEFGGATIKDFAFSTRPPSDKLSADGEHVGVLGYQWHTVKEQLFLATRPTAFGRTRRTRKVVGEEDNLWQLLRQNFTKRTLAGQLAGVYDPKGLATPITALLKLDLAEIVSLKTDWDDHLPDNLMGKWVDNLTRIQELRRIPFPRAAIHPEAVSSEVEAIVSVDASKDVAVAAVHLRSELPDGRFACRLLMSKSKLVHLTTVPRAELRAAVMGATIGNLVLINLKDQIKSMIFVSDSTIVLHWMKQDTRPLQTAVRNGIIEIRRLSDVSQWFHIASENNVADIGTRFLDLSEVGPDSDWVRGRPWMRASRDQFPLRRIDQVQLGSEELSVANKEVKVAAMQVSVHFDSPDKVAQRYDFSRYIVDPCGFVWPRSLNVLATVFRFLRKVKEAINRRKKGNAMQPPSPLERVLVLSKEEIQEAERYFFLRATREVKEFAKPKLFKDCTEEVDGVLFFKSRILDGQVIKDQESILGEVKPMHFFKPVVERFSPIAYSVMNYVHVNLLNHMDPIRTLRESRSVCYVLGGRDLAIEIVERCNYCRKKRAEKLQNEMAKIHPNALTVGPAFFNVQVDMAGPWLAECEHNCRSRVKVYALIFKDPSTCAIAVYAMPAADSAAFVQAYNRHAFRYGHPAKVYIDAGSQLIKGCEEAEFSWCDVVHLITSRYGVGFDYEVCPPHAHYFHGAVERSVKEVKRIFNAVFKGRKLQLLSFETAFAFCSNNLNNLPISLGSQVSHLGHRDVLTPNRLLLGRNNRRAPDSMTVIHSNSRIAEQLKDVEQAWWKMWEEERLVDFIPQPAKWNKSNNHITVGNVVVFPMKKENSPLKEMTWKYGKVVEILPSRDEVARRLRITYQNYGEEFFRFVNRGAREVAVLHDEDDLEFFKFLRETAKKFEAEPVAEATKAWTGVPKLKPALEEELACFCQL